MRATLHRVETPVHLGDAPVSREPIYVDLDVAA
jgi:hypothetical protein